MQEVRSQMGTHKSEAAEVPALQSAKLLAAKGKKCCGQEGAEEMSELDIDAIYKEFDETGDYYAGQYSAVILDLCKRVRAVEAQNQELREALKEARNWVEFDPDGRLNRQIDAALAYPKTRGGEKL